MESVVLTVLMTLGLLVWTGLPPALNALGLHPQTLNRPYRLTGQRALIITTGWDRLGDTGKKTGVWASEMTAPYYVFRDAGLRVDLATLPGGRIPIEPGSTDWPLAAASDQRFLADPQLRFASGHAYAIADLDFSDYDIVFLAGGWGAAYDLGQSRLLGAKIAQAWEHGAILGGVCHGPLGLLQARLPDGRLLIAGRHLTAVSDKQINELGITFTPLHPERELRAAGALYENATALTDLLANHVVVDGRLVTGQNQNAGGETAEKMLEILQRSVQAQEP